MERFDAAAKNSEYRKISELWGFQALRSALGEYAIEPVALGQRQVRSGLSSLLDSLDQVRTGAGWKQYLQTEQIRRIAQSKIECPIRRSSDSELEADHADRGRDDAPAQHGARAQAERHCRHVDQGRAVQVFDPRVHRANIEGPIPAGPAQNGVAERYPQTRVAELHGILQIRRQRGKRDRALGEPPRGRGNI